MQVRRRGQEAAARAPDALGYADQAALRPGVARRRSSASRASTRSRAASIRRCTSARCGRCGSTPASARPRRPTQRFKYLLESGQTGLSVALDLPTQLGFDSDAPEARRRGRQGRRGDRLARRHGDHLRGHPARQGLDVVHHQRHGDDPARHVPGGRGESRASPSERIAGTIQNDLLKEFGARGAWIFPIAPSMRLVVDAIQYCTEHLPRFNPISIASHFRDAGATPAEEAAYTLSDGVAYVEGVPRSRHEDRRVRAAALVLLLHLRQLLRGGREVSRGAAHLGAPDEGEASAPKTPSRGACASPACAAAIR